MRGTVVKPFGQNLLVMLTEERSGSDLRRPPAESDWPTAHDVIADFRMRHGLADPAFVECRVPREFLRIQHRAGGNGRAADQVHRGMLVVAKRPFGDNPVD